MKLAASVLLFVSTLIAVVASAQSCESKPDGSQIYVVQPKCDNSSPCLPGQSLTLELKTRTTCYPWYAPCPGYTIQACDTIVWSFGDGSSATATGNPGISHRWSAPGVYSIDAKVTNPHGSSTVSTAVVIAASPVAFVSFSDSVYTVAETAGHINATLRRTGDRTRRVTIDYRTGYAIGTVDRNLEIVEGKVVFEPGETTRTVTIPVIDDHVYNGDSYHYLWIECYTGEALLPRVVMGNADIRILEDERAPTATSAGTVRVPEGDRGATMLRFPVTLSQSFSEEVQLWWTIWEETAKRESDWAPPKRFMSGPLLIPPGATSGDLSVQILGDTEPETDETFRIELIRSGGPALVIDGSPVRVTIVNDDISFSADSQLIPAGKEQRLTLFTGAIPSATTLQLQSTDPAIVEVPATVSVAAGSLSSMFKVKAGRPGTAEVRASLDGTSRTASTEITVYQPVVPSFERGAIELHPQRAATATLRVEPSPTEPIRVTLASSKPLLVQHPSSITVPVSGKANFPIKGLVPGTTSVVATLVESHGQPAATMSVTVVEETAPTIVSITPAVAPTTGGTSVTILGENFSPDCSVLFGNLFATVASRSASAIVATAPPSPSGLVDVSLLCSSRTASIPDAFRYWTPRHRATRK